MIKILAICLLFVIPSCTRTLRDGIYSDRENDPRVILKIRPDGTYIHIQEGLIPLNTGYIHRCSGRILTYWRSDGERYPVLKRERMSKTDTFPIMYRDSMLQSPGNFVRIRDDITEAFTYQIKFYRRSKLRIGSSNVTLYRR